MCGTIWWVVILDDSTTLQSIYSMHQWPPLQRSRNEICWRIVTSMLSFFQINAYTWHALEDVIFYGQWINLRDQWQNWPKPVTNTWIDWYLKFITHVKTYGIAMSVILHNNAGWDCFKTPILREILRFRNPLLEELCAFWSQTFVPISWMCKKQTSVSHRSTESEIISLDAGLRLDWILALDLWDLIVSVHGNTIQTSEGPERPVIIDKSQRSRGKTNVLINIDCVPSNVQSSNQEAWLYVSEDNEAVIKMIIKGRCPTMRHVSRTHRVAFDGLFDRINLDSIQIKYIDTKNQLADILTKGNFTRDEWNHLLCLYSVSHFSSTVCSDTMA